MRRLQVEGGVVKGTGKGKDFMYASLKKISDGSDRGSVDVKMPGDGSKRSQERGASISRRHHLWPLCRLTRVAKAQGGRRDVAIALRRWVVEHDEASVAPGSSACRREELCASWRRASGGKKRPSFSIRFDLLACPTETLDTCEVMEGLKDSNY